MMFQARFIAGISFFALFCCFMSDAQAALMDEFDCDMNNDQNMDTVRIFPNRAVVQIKNAQSQITSRIAVPWGRTYRFGDGYWQASCEDRSGDARLEIVLTRGPKTKVFKVFGSGNLSDCGRINAWPSNLIYKTKGSDHFSSGDPRRNAVNVIAKWGFSGSDSCIDVYANDGTKLGQMGRYGSWVGGPHRWYGPTPCGNLSISGSTLAQRARNAAGSPNIYVKIANTCYGPIDASRCRNSSTC